MAPKKRLPELVSIQMSPWSLKARFALKHHGVEYKTTPYLPVLGDLMLRWRLGQWSGRVTVPVLFLDLTVVKDSFEIAKWSDAHNVRSGAGQLFPPNSETTIRRWNALSDAVLFYGRKQIVEYAQQNEAFALNFLPWWLRGLGPVSRAVAQWGIGRFASKYQKESSSTSREAARAALATTSSTLKASGGQYLLGPEAGFTYADIVMVCALQAVSPIGAPYAKSISNTKRPMLLADLAAEFPDLIAWRDEIFRRHWPLREGEGGAPGGTMTPHAGKDQ